MQYQNFDLHGVAEIIENDDGSISWLRVPSKVAERLEGRIAASQVRGATGVELRFVIRSGDSATVRMSRQGERSYAPFHVYRGGVQGGNRDHEEDKIVDNGLHGYKISRSQNLDRLKIISEKKRILLFSRGHSHPLRPRERKDPRYRRRRLPPDPRYAPLADSAYLRKLDHARLKCIDGVAHLALARRAQPGP